MQRPRHTPYPASLSRHILQNYSQSLPKMLAWIRPPPQSCSDVPGFLVFICACAYPVIWGFTLCAPTRYGTFPSLSPAPRAPPGLWEGPHKSLLNGPFGTQWWGLLASVPNQSDEEALVKIYETLEKSNQAKRYETMCGEQRLTVGVLSWSVSACATRNRRRWVYIQSLNFKNIQSIFR